MLLFSCAPVFGKLVTFGLFLEGPAVVFLLFRVFPYGVRFLFSGIALRRIAFGPFPRALPMRSVYWPLVYPDHFWPMLFACLVFLPFNDACPLLASLHF